MSTENHIDWDAVIDRLKRGWTKAGGFGSYDAPTGRVCLVGAVAWSRRTHDVYDLEDELRTVLEPIVKDHFPDRVTGLNRLHAEDFNDHPDTTLDDVILVCEKARGSSWA